MVWKNLKHFTQNENWGNPERMNPALLILLDSLREKVGYPFVINCGYAETGHAAGSRHYKGDAVDFHITGIRFDDAVDRVLKALHELEVFGQVSAIFVGLGIYPDWNTPGFHIDFRGYSARWGKIGGEYVSFDKAYSYLKRGDK